jgi:hypothetical protein
VLPRTVGSWITYALCAFVLAAGVVDQAFGGLMPFVLLGMLLVGFTSLLQLTNLPSRWRTSRWRSLLPLLACVLVLPGIWTIGPRLIVARFYWHRSDYERIAEAVRSGKRPETLGPNEQAVAYWVKAMRVRDLEQDVPMFVPGTSTLRQDYLKIVGVHFGTVTHGFAAHVGFMRTFDAEAARHLDKGHGADGWSYSKPLTNNWYLVGD